MHSINLLLIILSRAKSHITKLFLPNLLIKILTQYTFPVTTFTVTSQQYMEHCLKH